MSDREHVAELPAPAQRAYEAVLARIDQGHEVDWPDLLRRHPSLEPHLKRLQNLQQIQQAFRAVLPSDVEPLERGSQHASKGWGDFVVGEKLGEGTFAEVFRAQDPGLQREVALKLARGESVGQRRRFLEEGRRLALIDHPGVVRVHGAAVHDDRAGVWMDLATGRTLAERLEQDGRFAIHEAIDIARQLASALAAVHSADLVHGDIKPANVLRRDGGSLMLADFGSALDLRDKDNTTRSATPLTAAPEVLDGRAADARSDLYSLGVLLYNLLTARFPYEGSSLEAIRRAQREGDSIPLRELRPEVPRPLALVIERCFAVDPDDRFRSAVEFQDALEQVPTRQPSTGLRPVGVVALVALMAVFAWLALRGPATQVETRAARVSPPVSTAAATDARSGVIDLAASGLEAEVTLWRSGSSQPLRSGDAITLGDALHVRVENTAQPVWLYLVNEDSNGATFALFPLPDVEPTNPLAPGDWRLPGRLDGVDQDWIVTSESGTESFLMVASARPLPHLESALAELELASATDPPPSGADRREGQPSASLPVRTRGLGGLAPAIDAQPETLLRLQRLVMEPSSPAEPDASTPFATILTLRGPGYTSARTVD